MLALPPALDFELVVRAADGTLQTRRVRAADAVDASAKASGDGLRVLTCEARGRSPALRVRRRSPFDMATLTQELASLVEAGLSVISAWRALAAKATASARRAPLLQLIAALREGLRLSTALAQQPQVFPPLLIATVAASEQTGDLSGALTRYADHQRRFHSLRDKVFGAAVYPLLLLVVGSLVVVFLLGVVVPRFAALIESAHQQLPWTSRLLLDWGRLVSAHPVLVALPALLVVSALPLLAIRLLRGTGARGRWLERLPGIGHVVRQFRHAQLYRTTGMLVQGGVSAVKALQLSAGLLGPDDRARLQHALRLIGEGHGLSRSLDEAGLGDPVAMSMLAVAERTGGLADILERISQFHERRLQRAIELISRLFEPALMIVIGLVIGGIVVLMYLPIFDLASSLQ
jgi:general secretion pathway protein F